jgi:hypothetical protein
MRQAKRFHESAFAARGSDDGDHMIFQPPTKPEQREIMGAFHAAAQFAEELQGCLRVRAPAQVPSEFEQLIRILAAEGT